MVKKLLFYICLLYCLPLHSQIVTVSDMVNISVLTDKKLNGYVEKLGFVPTTRHTDDETTTTEFFFNNKKDPTDTVIRFLSGYKRGKITGSIFETSSYAEFQSVLRGFKGYGFITGNKKDTAGIDSSSLFQKEDMTARSVEDKRDEVRVFKIVLEKRPVPNASNVRFADDLFLFDSHESLASFFGPDNVHRDVYHFSETDSSRCSVLFPNSNRQAIFIWDDQVNDRTISFLMIGGGLRAESSADFNQSVPLNLWKTSSGLFTGMRLQEIVDANENDFTFYGMDSEFSFMAVPQNKGVIDFKKTGISMGCFNCTGVPLIRKEKITAQSAIDAGLQLFIVSIILMP